MVPLDVLQVVFERLHEDHLILAAVEVVEESGDDWLLLHDTLVEEGLASEASEAGHHQLVDKVAPLPLLLLDFQLEDILALLDVVELLLLGLAEGDHVLDEVVIAHLLVAVQPQ